jgi:predicted nucleotidyltransferase
MRQSCAPLWRWLLNTMSINSAIDRIISDWKDLLCALVTEEVQFLVIGGYAVMKYTEPYNTKDLDLWTNPQPENAARLYRGLARFGAPLKGITPEYFTVAGNFYQIGVSRWRVDILTSTAADLSFESAWSRRGEMIVAGVTVPVIGLDDLIVTKQATGRDRDLVVVKELKARQRS